ncbi:PIN domain-containing protein [Streptomyces sp. SCA3-4]|uniref:PIN domain-containing protein n=1 Tax=Streptomyces sichuanensis TaxID=2871810 RepID=UPI001CE29993|nr:PIN domain-containing protein [Streptomyces sichuanensis]MCA6090918.1 PIN domain-containing protein [Streptomyces sichuanensis]
MIVLDSNQLRLFAPGSPALRLFAAVAVRAGHTVATTDTAIQEVVRQRRDELSSAHSALMRAEREINALTTSPGNYVRFAHPTLRNRPLFVAEETARFESELRDAFRVLETTPQDALEALRWEAEHRPPCRNGSGARDAAIWLTAARACQRPDTDKKGRQLPVIFVSKDKDFTQPGDPSRLDEALRSELTDSGMLILKSEVVHAMAELGYPRRNVNAEKITNREDFRQTLIGVIRDGAAPWVPNVIESAEAIISMAPGGRAYECRGDGTRLISISGTWNLQFVTEPLPPQPNGQPGGHKGLPMGVQGMALLVEDEQTEATKIDFFPQITSFASMGEQTSW